MQTESDLKKWDNLKKDEAVGKLTATKREQLETLSENLSERSEELKLIVNSPGALQTSLLNKLVSRPLQKRPQSRPQKGNGNRPPRNAKLR